MSPLSLDHYSGLCVTGGNQPYTGLRPDFQQQTSDWPVSLDAPMFSPAGSMVGPDFGWPGQAVQNIVILGGRL